MYHLQFIFRKAQQATRFMNNSWIINVAERSVKFIRNRVSVLAP
jgi:hypothetical protein